MNVFICGVPRSGKTTLSKLLKKELKDFNIIISESVRNGFQKMDRENYKEWGNKHSIQRREKFPEFLFEFLKWNSFFSECNNIVDLALIDLKTVLLNKGDEDLVVCLGFGKDKLNEEIFSFIRERENESDYTRRFSDEELVGIWGNICDIDKNNIKVCEDNNIKYFDVFKNEDMIGYILDKLNIEIK